jgi:heme-degrading monooxygenase HmoA
MIVLHVQLRIRPGVETGLEDCFRSDFAPAIRVQPGFQNAQLLRPYRGNGEYVISIAFDSEELRRAWAGSPEHQVAWSKVEALCSAITDAGFDVVADV